MNDKRRIEIVAVPVGPDHTKLAAKVVVRNSTAKWCQRAVVALLIAALIAVGAHEWPGVAELIEKLLLTTS